MADPLEPRLPWYRPTPDRAVIGLLALEGLLSLSERFRWFPFNAHKGWTVLICVASVSAWVLLMLGWFAAALVFRWRFQFSIRSLLLLTVAVALPCSWLSRELKKAREQQEAVEGITKLGGWASPGCQISTKSCLICEAEPPPPVWLQNLLGDEFFRNTMAALVLTDAELAHIKGLPDHQTLCLVLQHHFYGTTL
ncbi:MAG: hypothetical protein ABR915_11265 [Thermoguttaceae bacterium]|jgi:hypothetical protein